MALGILGDQLLIKPLQGACSVLSAEKQIEHLHESVVFTLSNNSMYLRTRLLLLLLLEIEHV